MQRINRRFKANQPSAASLLSFILVVVIASMLTGCGAIAMPASQSTAPPDTAPPPGSALASGGQLKTAVNHIIFMLQENRSFDHYFGKLNDYRATQGLAADVDGLPVNASNPSHDGSTTIAAFHLKTMCVENPTPSWDEAHYDWNRNDPTASTATLDGFVLTAASFAQDTGLHDTEGRRAMGYYTSDDLPVYYFLATQFATSDRWFAPVMTRTQPNRMFLMAGDSDGHVFPEDLTNQVTEKTIFEELDNAGVSWKIYSASQSASFFNTYSYANTRQDHVATGDEFLSDLKNGTLPQVVEIEPGYLDGSDEHPGINPKVPGANVRVGEAFVANLISALMASQYWKDSIFILTWDESGGFYDHVAPQPAVPPNDLLPTGLQHGDICFDGKGANCGFNYTGYRVPLIVVSPFTKPHFVSHTVADYTAILRLIETRFGLAALTKRDAAQMDMTEFFDFQHPAWTMPPQMPAEPPDGPCYFDSLP